MCNPFRCVSCGESVSHEDSSKTQTRLDEIRDSGEGLKYTDLTTTLTGLGSGLVSNYFQSWQGFDYCPVVCAGCLADLETAYDQEARDNAEDEV